MRTDLLEGQRREVRRAGLVPGQELGDVYRIMVGASVCRAQYHFGGAVLAERGWL